MAKSREDILETIRKCLALSTSSNEHEAALAAVIDWYLYPDKEVVESGKSKYRE